MLATDRVDESRLPHVRPARQRHDAGATVMHPSVRRKRAMAVEEALDRPASEQIDPSRPERREAVHVSGGQELPQEGVVE